MKKLLSFILIASLAVMGLFAITTDEIDGSTLSLASPVLLVNIGSAPASVALYYSLDGGTYPTTSVTSSPITNTTWTIQGTVQDATQSPISTNKFGVLFENGFVHPSSEGATTENYKVTVIPGPFQTATGTIALKNDGTSYLIPTAEVVSVGTGTSVGDTLTIISDPIQGDTYFQRMEIANFKLSWTPVTLVANAINPNGTYTCTTSVQITTN